MRVKEKNKHMFKKILGLFELVGLSRAASQLASQGYYNEAKALMTEFHKKREEKTKAKNTIKELKKLSDRELDDLGISRYDINVQGVLNHKRVA